MLLYIKNKEEKKASMLEFFEIYGVWIVVGAIIILLAIIGRYAEKTNFGQKKVDELEENNNKVINNNLNNFNINNVESLKNQKIDGQNISQSNKTTNSNETNHVNANTSIVKNESLEPKETSETSNINEKEISKNIESDNTFEKKYEALDDEINSLLPKKELINEDLLDDINSLSLDRTQKIKLSDIPDLDDVDLPKIKDLNKQDDDIWKF